MKVMEIRQGGDSLLMPRVALGADKFSEENRYGEYGNLMDRYYEHGGTCIDTARVYCAWLGPDKMGISEKLVGRWVRERGLRNHIVLSTKGGHPPLSDMQKSRLDAESLSSDLSESLKALQTSYVDVYFLHRDNESMDVSQIMPTLHEFVQSGKVRFLGASNWKAKRIAQANEFARQNGLTPFSLSQINFSLGHTTPEMIGDPTIVCMDGTEYGWYLKNAFPVMCFSSQAKGFFSKYLAGEALNSKIDERFFTQANIRRAQRVRELSLKYGVSPAAVVLAYLTCNPAKLCAVAAFSTSKQMEDSLGGAGPNLTPEEIAVLERG